MAEEKHIIPVAAWWSMLDKFTRLFSGVLVTAVLARYLGPTGYAELAYAISLCALCQVVIGMGLDSTVIKELAQGRYLPGKILGVTATIKCVVACLAYVVAIVATAYYRDEHPNSTQISAILLAGVFFQPADVCDLFFTAMGRSMLASIARMTGTVISAAIKLYGIYAELSSQYFAFAYAVEVAFGASLVAIFFLKTKERPILQFDKQVALLLLSETWALALSAIFVGIYTRFDQLLLISLAGPREAGLYAAIVPFTLSLGFIPMAIAANTMPSLAKAKENGEEVYLLHFQRLMGVMAAISLVIAALYVVGADFFVTSLLGTEYVDAIPAMRLYSIACIPMFLGVAQSQWIVLEGRQHLALIKSFVGAFSSIALNFLLVKEYGALGGSMSALAAQFISSVALSAAFSSTLFKMQVLGILGRGVLWGRRNNGVVSEKL